LTDQSVPRQSGPGESLLTVIPAGGIVLLMASPFEERLVKAFRCSSNAHCRFGFKNPFFSNTKNTIPHGMFLENVLLR